MFNVGERVVAIKEIDYKISKGSTGTIVHDSKYDSPNLGLGVQWDNYINGHNCCGKGKEGYCWYVDYASVELLSNKELKIRWFKKGKLE